MTATTRASAATPTSPARTATPTASPTTSSGTSPTAARAFVTPRHCSGRPTTAPSTGSLPDEVFFSGGHDQTLGTPKEGLSDDLDALAVYLKHLLTELKSPYRQPDGAFTPEALAGRALFESAETGCTTCHAGPRLTDSAFLPQGPGSPKMPLLHDVGTLKPSSGQRLGGPLPGIDTPTLLGVWATAPYLHDGSSPTIEAVLTTANPSDQHGKTSHLTPSEIAAIVAYLQQLEPSP